MPWRVLEATAVAVETNTQRTTASQRALQLVDVRLLDHIVIAGGTHASFALRGRAEGWVQ